MRMCLIFALGLLAFSATAQKQLETINITSVESVPRGLRITWEGGIPPYKLQSSNGRVDGNWDDVSFHIYANSYVVSSVRLQSYFRVRSIPDKTPPPALKGFGPRHVNCRTVRFSWDALRPDEYGGTGLRGTRIYRDGVFLYEVAAPMTVFIDTSVASDTAYTYWASAVDEAGNESPRSGTRAVDTLSCDQHATLAWDANPEPDIAGYHLHYGTESGNYTMRIDTGPATWFRVPGLISGTTYYFAATAYNTRGQEGEFSEEVVYLTP